MRLIDLFRRPDYRSDTTLFIEQLKLSQPHLQERQYAGRALLWDKAVDRQCQREFELARVAQKPYVYQTDNT